MMALPSTYSVLKSHNDCAKKGKKCKNTYCRNNQRGKCTRDPR